MDPIMFQNTVSITFFVDRCAWNIFFYRKMHFQLKLSWDQPICKPFSFTKTFYPYK